MMDKKELKIGDFVNKISERLCKLKKIGIEQFNDRILTVEHLLSQSSKHTVRSGMVGITSSGKSSLLNVLLGTGEKILKEQTKATTNVLVFCSKSQEPQLDVFFETGERITKTGSRVLSESIWKYTSEDENPNNKCSVKYIKLGLPTFILDEDIEIADTPGLDAYGLKEHEDLTLREFLPQADLIIYLSSIRSPIKEADKKILNRIMDADQKIIFVQTCKGSVEQINYGEDSLTSIEQQLDNYKNELQKSTLPYAKLKDAPIVQIETSLAMKYFTYKDMNAWRQSGLEEFVYVVSNITKQIYYEYILKDIHKIVDAINSLTVLAMNIFKEDGEKGKVRNEQYRNLDKLKQYLEKMIDEKDLTIKYWREKLDYASSYSQYKNELSKIYSYRYDYNPAHDIEFAMKAQSINERIQRLKRDFLESLDNARNKYTDYFNEMSLDIRRMDIQRISSTDFFLPNLQRRSLSEKVKSLSERLKQSSKISETECEYIDKEKFIQDLGEAINLFFTPLISHLEWWDRAVSYSFIEPLKDKISSIENDIYNIGKDVSYTMVEYKNVVDICNKLHSDVKDISSHFSDVNIVEQQFASYSKSSKSTLIQKLKSESRNIFLQLSNRIFEGLYHNYYLRLLSEFSKNKRKTVLLISQNYESQVGFLARLLRLGNNSITKLRETKRPFAINSISSLIDIESIHTEGELDDIVTFYVLSNDDKSYHAAANNNLFENTDVVQVMIDDLHRVGSALTDIVDRNVFYKLLQAYKDKLLLSYAGGAHFQRYRLNALVDEVMAEFDKIFTPASIKWFIYENFEIRYNYFYEIASRMRHYSLSPYECINEWKKLGIPLDDPFTEDILLDQFAELYSG
ncbi:Dynamin, GTPase region domain protein [Candidatus Magnetoovum chiemensis]|nr:Dynamin, GTPase region domain protein [Candidatus Magnetoovum chiemensis]